MDNNMLTDDYASDESINSNSETFSVYDFVCLFVAIKRVYGDSLFSPYILNNFIKKCKEHDRFKDFLSCFECDYTTLIDVVKKLMFDGYLDYANTSFRSDDYLLFESAKGFPTQKILCKYKMYQVKMTLFVSSYITYQNEVFINKNSDKNKKRTKSKE